MTKLQLNLGIFFGLVLGVIFSLLGFISLSSAFFGLAVSCCLIDFWLSFKSKYKEIPDI
jgi:hypothetical protein